MSVPAPSSKPQQPPLGTQQQSGSRNNSTSGPVPGAGPRHRRSPSKASVNGNGPKRSNSGENSKPVNKLTTQETEIISKHMDDRILHLLANAVGSKCIVTVTSGTRYIGLLYTTTPTGDNRNFSIVLKMPEIYSVSSDDELDPNEELPDTLTFDSKDFADFEILNLDLAKSDKNRSVSPLKTSFKTDSDISANRKVEERELEKWVPEETDLILSGGLEDDFASTKNWDQFAVNERKFGIQSSFNEEMYTTKISKDDPKYKERLVIAEKLAREIEGSSHNGNVHLAEERGLVVDDSGLDEEDKYSGVDRRGEELMAAIGANKSSGPKNYETDKDVNSNKYLPPRQRAAQYHDDPAVISSSATAQGSTDKKLPATLPDKPVTPASNPSKINSRSELNSLKEFSATFKIPTKFPKELLPIVTKDKHKQEEILKKYQEDEDAALAAKKAKEKEETEKSEKAKEEQPVVPVKKKMDPRTATTFKMNPNAPTFQPSGFAPPAAIRSSYSSRSPTTGHASPRISQPPVSKKNITPQGFFGSRVPKETRSGDSFKDSFNFLSDMETEADLVKPFSTAPAWDQEMDKSYITLYQLVPEKVMMPPPPMLNVRYYPPGGSALQSPMGAPASQLMSPGTPLSPSHMHPQQVPMMMPVQQYGGTDDGNRKLSPSPQLMPPYYPQFIPQGPPGMVAPQSQQMQNSPSQQLGTSPRQQRHHNRHNNSHHHHHNNNNQYLQQQQLLQMGQYPVVIPIPPQGQYARGAPVNYPAMGYYVVGSPQNGRQF